MVFTTEQLKEKYKNYGNPLTKISRDVKSGKLFRVKKGLYVDETRIDGMWLSQYVYGPSYLSFELVLSDKGLIPEMVFDVFPCASLNKRKRKEFYTQFGLFHYRDIPAAVFHLGVKVAQERSYIYHIATLEKALCDRLYLFPPLESIKGLKEALFEDLRIEEEDFDKLNKEDMLKFAPLYKSSNLNLLAKFIKKEMKKNEKHNNPNAIQI